MSPVTGLAMAKPQTTVKYFVICPGYHFNGGLADEVEKKAGGGGGGGRGVRVALDSSCFRNFRNDGQAHTNNTSRYNKLLSLSAVPGSRRSLLRRRILRWLDSQVGRRTGAVLSAEFSHMRYRRDLRQRHHATWVPALVNDKK